MLISAGENSECAGGNDDAEAGPADCSPVGK